MFNENFQTAKIKILVFGKFFEFHRETSYRNANEILHIDKKTIKFLKETKTDLIFEIKISHAYVDIRRSTKNKIYYKTLDIFIDHKHITPKVISVSETYYLKHRSDLFKNPDPDYKFPYTENLNNIYMLKDPVFHYIISYKNIEKFIKHGGFANNYSRDIRKVSLKLKNEKHKVTPALAEFILNFWYDFRNELWTNRDHFKYTNLRHKIVQLIKNNKKIHPFFDCFVGRTPHYQNQTKLPELYYSAYKKKLAILWNSSKRYAVSYRDNKYKFSNKFKKYFLVKFIEASLPYFDSKKIKTEKDFFSSHLYEDCLVKKTKNLGYKLVPPTDIKLVKVNGEYYLPLPYNSDDINEAQSYGHKFHPETFNQDLSLIRPSLAENFYIKELHFNPNTQKWDFESYCGLNNKTTTAIIYDKAFNIWKSQQTRQWAAVSNPTKILLSLKKNFSVVCTHRQNTTIAQSMGIDRFSHTPDPLSRAINLKDLLPEQKINTDYYKNESYIYIRQSTFGLKSKEFAKIVEIDPKTQKIIKNYGKAFLGSAYKIDKEKFYNNSLALILGPGTCRLDFYAHDVKERHKVANSIPVRHTVLVTGYMKSKNETIPGFNY